MLALLLPACGGSSQPGRHTTITTAAQDHNTTNGAQDHGTTTAAHEPGVPRASTKERTAASTRPQQRASATVHRSVPVAGPRSTNDRNHAAAGRPTLRVAAAANPCALVSTSEARTILGGPIAAPVAAPQGPTCIFRPIRDKRVVTLSIQSVEFAKLRAQIHDLRPIKVRDRIGYCGSYGQPAVFVPLSTTRMLNVTASCDTAKRLAAAALIHVHS